MGDVTTLEMVRRLYDYHWWANRRLFDVAAELGETVCARDVGKQFSFPTLRGMFAHICGVDDAWLQRWKAVAPVRRSGDGDFATLRALRQRWDEVEAQQAEFTGALTPSDLGRIVEFTSVAYPRPGDGFYHVPLWPLLQHVANHATHHRSEIGTMLTMVQGSPPGTDLALYYFCAQGFTG